ncbi:MAG: hypothetical protein ACLS26_00585 [Eubacterium sp.]
MKTATFFDEDIEAEKRILIEKINSEENEKRIYVLRKTEEKNVFRRALFY